MSVDVEALRAALAKATRAPWDSPGNGVVWSDPTGFAAFVADCGSRAKAPDAELIVLLRNNAEALLDELDRAQAASEGVDMLVQQAERRGAQAGAQALWDVYAALGFDTDGDATPDAWMNGPDGVARFTRMVVEAAKQHRRESEEGYDQDLVDAERRGIYRALDEFKELPSTWFSTDIFGVDFSAQELSSISAAVESSGYMMDSVIAYISRFNFNAVINIIGDLLIKTSEDRLEHR